MNRSDCPTLTDREWRAACLNDIEDNSSEVLKRAASVSAKFAEIEHDLRHGNPTLSIITDIQGQVQAALAVLVCADIEVRNLAAEIECAAISRIICREIGVAVVNPGSESNDERDRRIRSDNTVWR